MALYSTEALILRTYRLGEADRIVVFLTSDRGKKRGVAKGARRTKSRFLGALEPLTQVQVVYYERENRDLVSLNDIETVWSPMATRQPDSLPYVSYFAELIDAWALEANPDQRLYRLGASVLEAMVIGAPINQLARYFEYWLLRLQGVYPSLIICQTCSTDLAMSGARVLESDGVFVCQNCGPVGRGAVLSSGAVVFLRALAKVRPQDLAKVSLTLRANKELEVAHRMLITTHLEKELRSNRVLQELNLS